MGKLEQLLNSLIEKGWKPFGREARHELSSWVVYDTIDFKWKRDIRVIDRRHHHIRELVAKESLLRQFVCDREHRFIDKKNYNSVSLDKRLKNPYADYDDVNTDYEWITVLDYKYRLIESALKDEGELEDFLLDNIKIEWE